MWQNAVPNELEMPLSLLWWKEGQLTKNSVYCKEEGKTFYTIVTKIHILSQNNITHTIAKKSEVFCLWNKPKFQSE